jgi:hypothetical protein
MALSPRLQAKPFDPFDRGSKGGGITARAATQSENRLGVTFQHHLRTAIRVGAPERAQEAAARLVINGVPERKPSLDRCSTDMTMTRLAGRRVNREAAGDVGS